jgi:hypothetical protein
MIERVSTDIIGCVIHAIIRSVKAIRSPAMAVPMTHFFHSESIHLVMRNAQNVSLRNSWSRRGNENERHSQKV